MKTFRSILIASVVSVGGILSVAPAFAVPPTAQVNPGYDRRLSESRHYRHYYSAPVRPYRHRRYHRY